MMSLHIKLSRFVIIFHPPTLEARRLKPLDHWGSPLQWLLIRWPCVGHILCVGICAKCSRYRDEHDTGSLCPWSSSLAVAVGTTRAVLTGIISGGLRTEKSGWVVGVGL